MMKSTSVGSSSPKYSTIFLDINGLILSARMPCASATSHCTGAAYSSARLVGMVSINCFSSSALGPVVDAATATGAGAGAGAGTVTAAISSALYSIGTSGPILGPSSTEKPAARPRAEPPLPLAPKPLPEPRFAAESTPNGFLLLPDASGVCVSGAGGVCVGSVVSSNVCDLSSEAAAAFAVVAMKAGVVGSTAGANSCWLGVC
mmetsp:Transcript_21991/g.50545  ORF Transcript_21991/g.50545 Transcript_21991/m.50545 type:complete len:204 (+) Transcript_21991:1091-1702(+)